MIAWFENTRSYLNYTEAQVGRKPTRKPTLGHTPGTGDTGGAWLCLGIGQFYCMTEYSCTYSCTQCLTGRACVCRLYDRVLVYSLQVLVYSVFNWLRLCLFAGCADTHRFTTRMIPSSSDRSLRQSTSSTLPTGTRSQSPVSTFLLGGWK